MFVHGLEWGGFEMVPYVIEIDNKNNERVYDIYSRLLKDRIIMIGSEFTPELANSVVSQLLFLESQDKNSDIYIYVNSPGGCMASMFAILDTMNYIIPDIVTIGMGTVASAASVILAAGTKGKRFALPNTEIMIHQPSSGTYGKVTDMEIQLEQSRKFKEKIVEFYSAVSGRNKKQVIRDIDRDYFMTSEEAVAYGLIDTIKSKRSLISDKTDEVSKIVSSANKDNTV
jgi:ATP-dependent Clp protease protease subunit